MMPARRGVAGGGGDGDGNEQAVSPTRTRGPLAVVMGALQGPGT